MSCMWVGGRAGRLTNRVLVVPFFPQELFQRVEDGALHAGVLLGLHT